LIKPRRDTPSAELRPALLQFFMHFICFMFFLFRLVTATRNREDHR
jgi:hypothetical protein